MSAYDPFAPVYDLWSEHMVEDVAGLRHAGAARAGSLASLR